MIAHFSHTWRVFALGAVLALSALLVGVVGASDSLRIEPFRGFSESGEEPYVFAGNYPYEQSGYAPLGAISALHHPEGLGVAYIDTTQADVGVAEVKFIPRPATPPDTIGIMYLSSVRYSVAGHDVYVVTSEPTPKTIQIPIILGKTAVDLGVGRMGYIHQQVERKPADKTYRKEFNRVAYAENGLIVSVFSDLPAEQLVAFAKATVLAK